MHKAEFGREATEMDMALWELFRETGDPMGYLLCKAEERARDKTPPVKKSDAPPPGPPPVSD